MRIDGIIQFNPYGIFSRIVNLKTGGYGADIIVTGGGDAGIWMTVDLDPGAAAASRYPGIWSYDRTRSLITGHRFFAAGAEDQAQKRYNQGITSHVLLTVKVGQSLHMNYIYLGCRSI